MLNDRERPLFEALGRQFHDDEPASSSPSDDEDRSATAPYGWLLEAAMGACIALIAVSDLLGRAVRDASGGEAGD